MKQRPPVNSSVVIANVADQWTTPMNKNDSNSYMIMTPKTYPSATYKLNSTLFHAVEGVHDKSSRKSQPQVRFFQYILLLAFGILNHISQVSAQSGPVASGLSSYVDKFTGDFNYQVPLLTITGPNGESFPLSLNYRAGIQVEQDAGWIGLGWDLSLGEIVRTVNGYPDDWKGKGYQMTRYTGYSVAPVENLLAYGPIHFKDIPEPTTASMQYQCTTCVSMDLYASRKNRTPTEPSFEFPDYDNYTAIGPMLAGNMDLHLFDYTNIFYKPSVNQFDHQFTPSEYLKTNKRPSFIFRGSGVLKVNAPFFSQTGYNDNCTCYPGGYSGSYPNGASLGSSWLSLTDNVNPAIIAQDFLTPVQLTPSNGPAMGSFGPGLVNGADHDTPRSGHFVEYFTNKEIADHYAGIATIPGFMDWELVTGDPHRNDLTRYDPDGIGAIRITDPNGLTYHYSLPVYVLNEKSNSFNLVWTSAGYVPPSNGATLDVVTKNDRFAVSWKLCAITGPDFQDNGDSHVGIGDAGYWIGIDHQRWTDAFPSNYPEYGFQQDLVVKNRLADFPGGPAARDTEYVPKGSSFLSTREIYYPNSIRTATQTAYFIKHVKLDGISSRRADGSVVPQLALKHVVLLNNRDISAQWFLGSTRPNKAEFTSLQNQLSGQQNAINLNQYNNNQSAIEQASLRTITLDQDYRLARGLYNNVKSGYSSIATSQLMVAGIPVAQNKPTTATNTDYTQSGKLCLNKLTVFDDRHVRITPSWNFEYTTDRTIDGVTDPLDFNPGRKDHFGYFKCDHDPVSNGGYTTELSQEHTQAWSLKKITDPLGADLSIDYESDIYESVGSSDVSFLPKPPQRFFWIKNWANNSTATLYDKDAVSDLLNSASNIRGVSLYYISAASSECNTSGYHFVDNNVTYYDVGTNNAIGLDYDPSPFCNTLSNNESDYLRIEYNRAYGGGLRVRTLTLADPTESSFSYSIGFEYSGGLCTIEPDPYDRDLYRIGNDGTALPMRSIYSNKSTGERHAPAPMIGYSKVKESVLNGSASKDGSVLHEFINYSEPFQLTSAFGHSQHGADQYEVDMCTVDGSLIGSPLNVTVLDANDNEIRKTTYQYETRSEASNRIEEVFYRSGNIGFNAWTWVGGTIDMTAHLHTAFYKRWLFRGLKAAHVFENGTLVSTIFSKDPFTSQTKARSTLQSGVGARGPAVGFAYLNYPQLGPKCLDPGNYNILTAPDFQHNGIDPATTSHWTDILPIRRFDPTLHGFTTGLEQALWAPDKSYIKNGTEYKYVGRTSLFSPRLQPLERKDLADVYTASKLTTSGDHLLAEATNCNYASFTFCGFENLLDRGVGSSHEYWFDGEVAMPSQNAATLVTESTTVHPHSGTSLLSVSPGSIGAVFRSAPSSITDGDEPIERGLLKGRTYRAMVWVHQSASASATLRVSLTGNYSIAAQMQRNDPHALQVGEWLRLEAQIAVPADFVTTSPEQGISVELSNVGGATAAWFDDMIMYPIDGSAMGSNWDERRGLMRSYIDMEGFVTKYTYDAAGTVIAVDQETETGLHRLSSTETGFAKQD